MQQIDGDTHFLSFSKTYCIFLRSDLLVKKKKMSKYTLDLNTSSKCRSISIIEREINIGHENMAHEMPINIERQRQLLVTFISVRDCLSRDFYLLFFCRY